VIGVDLGVKFDWTAICVAHLEVDRGERRVVCDDMVTFKPRSGAQVPLKEVENRVEALARRFNNATVFYDPNQALGMAQSLKERGVRVEEHPFTVRSNDRAATLLHTQLRDGLLDLPADNAELLDELLTVRVVETSQGLLSIDTRPGGHDDQTDALGICAVTLVERGPSRPGYAYSAAGHNMGDGTRLAQTRRLTPAEQDEERAFLAELEEVNRRIAEAEAEEVTP
jgi:hypothetical protein